MVGTGSAKSVSWVAPFDVEIYGVSSSANVIVSQDPELTPEDIFTNSAEIQTDDFILVSQAYVFTGFKEPVRTGQKIYVSYTISGSAYAQLYYSRIDLGLE